MKPKRPALYFAIPVLFLLSISLFSNFQQILIIWQQWRSVEINQDASSLWEKRIENLKADLPETGEIGYLSEMDIPGMENDPVDTNEEYVLTQYFLAPRKIIRSSHYPLVIGNFANIDIQHESDLETLIGLDVIASYGYGIYLLRGDLP